MSRRLLIMTIVALLLAAYVVGGRLLPGPNPAQNKGLSRDGDSAAPASATGSGSSAGLNPLEGIAAENFRAILEKPLFNRGRAPRPEEPPPPPPPPPEETPPVEPTPVGPNAQDFKLLAVSVGPSGRVAALRVAATGEVLYLREGNSVQAWKVISLNDRSLVLGTAENNVALSLFDDGQATAPFVPDEVEPEAAPQ